MRKKERQIITIGLIALFGLVAWWAYAGHGAGAGVLLNLDNQSNASEQTTYQLAVSDLQPTVDQTTGHAMVSFTLANEEHFNISSVQVLYALNVADPNNATYTALNATETNGTYKAEIPSKFGDVVYYKVKVAYDSGKALISDVKSITVSDTTAPTLTSVSLNITSTYNNATNTTTYNFVINFNATDNDQIGTYYVYWADLGTNNTVTNTTTFTVINATTEPIILKNITTNDYYAFYFVVQDLSGNKATLYNETAPFIVQANTSATWPVEAKGP
ncbi:hypothetical protein [Thermococcus sp.]|uniref:hypothetical protein n=1 Tax=Thermococcus sp. TaxID=35749 RepID=UPI0026387018|nr:hypothetical protein [Thermococcus sp.]